MPVDSRRSALPTGCAVTHIPTGTTSNYRINVDQGEDKSDATIVATSAIAADTEIGRATP
jgi:hypothetical protein